MNNIESNFVPYQIAVDMKSIGFDEKCIGLWQSKYNSVPYLNINSVENIDTLLSGKIHNEDVNYIVKSPLWQQSFLYLWNKTGRYIIPIPNDDKEWLCMGNKFKTYEEARLECLVKLIDIVKKQNLKG